MVRLCLSFRYYGPKAKRTKIQAIRGRLRDEPSDNEQTTQHSGSLKVLDISLDPKAVVPQTKVATRARHTQTSVVRTPQSEEGDNNRSRMP